MHRPGSRPETRGTRRRAGRTRLRGLEDGARHGARFTPACAGRLPDPGHQRHGVPVRPRVRGASVTGTPGSYTVTGSPPRARGVCRGDRLRASLGRFTPACAGRLAADHALFQWSWGSPPRARGVSGGLAEAGGDVRFTPACAGRLTCWFGAAPARLGSPPRARGVSDPGGWGRLRLRFTPACAGRLFVSAILGTLAAGSPPRARGVWRRWAPETSRSSVHPRVRGASRARGAGPVGRVGFTPACAGRLRP